MRQRGEHVNGRSTSVVMGRALSHPLRVRILMGMNAPARKLSPSEFADESGVSVGISSYHFRELKKCGCIQVVEEVQRRGATEHRYYPVKRAMAWTREWESLGAVIKQSLAATALGGAVEVIGEAVDQGTFESLPDSILAWGCDARRYGGLGEGPRHPRPSAGRTDRGRRRMRRASEITTGRPGFPAQLPDVEL
jgi:hypothetical protein